MSKSIKFDLNMLRTVKGKILGGAAGFAVGGPLGAVIGAVAGHAIDNLAREGEDGMARNALLALAGSQGTAFIIGVVVLGAKMARENTDMGKRDIEALMTAFRLPEEQVQAVTSLFAQMRDEAGGVEPYAEQLARLFREKPAALEELLDGLFRFALTEDGEIDPRELAYLRRISFIFGFSAAEFADRAASYGIQIGGARAPLAGENPFKILGLPPGASDSEVKLAWRKLTREYHPDQLVARNLNPEALAKATGRMAAINAAYDEICRARGLS